MCSGVVEDNKKGLQGLDKSFHLKIIAVNNQLWPFLFWCVLAYYTTLDTTLQALYALQLNDKELL